MPAAGAIASAPAFGAGDGCASRFMPAAGAIPFGFEPALDLEPAFDLAPACDFLPGAGLAPGARLGFAFALPLGFPPGFV